MMLVLKLPHSPLSALTTMTSVRLSRAGSRRSSSGWIDASTRDATLASTRCICTAYGRAFMIRSCARRSFDAATIFIALVICCVFFTARMRRRRSISDGMNHQVARTRPAIRSRGVCVIVVDARRCLAARELGGECLDRPVERRLQLIVELLLLGDAAEQLRVPASR